MKSVHIYSLIIGLLLLSTSLVSNVSLQSLVAKNIWSLRFINRILQSDFSGIQDQKPPAAHPHASTWLGMLALESRNPRLAIQLTSTPAALGDPFALNWMAFALEQTGNFPAATSAWSRARNPKALADSAERAYKNMRFDDALEAYRQAYMLNPQEYTLEFVFHLWNIHGLIKEAEAVLNKSIATFPFSAHQSVWHLKLGDLLTEQELWDEAELAYKQSLDIEPSQWQALIGLGRISFLENGDSETALEWINQAINISPDSGETYFTCGEILFSAGNYQDAQPCYQQALKKDTTHPYWYVAAGNNDRSLGRITNAIETYNFIISRNPKYSPAYYERSWAYAIANQLEDAGNDIQQAILLESKTPSWYFTRAGQIYEKKKELDLAETAYRKALLINPQDISALDGLERIGAINK